ncbi:two-component response regulator-like PRR1 isoform X2 [Musa acuminata AAA Group]
MTKGLKMLKYIMRNKDLSHIPIIIMSAQDEVSVVVKCLRLGAADYLMKPLRTNELLNLWTHMWRRRCMLGLTEKDVLSHNFEIQFSDPSDANMNSTTLISDDTDDKPSTIPNSKSNKSNYPECESHVSSAVHACSNPLHGVQHIPRDCDHAGGVISLPKKTELKVGESSAFLTFVKSSMASRTPRIGVDMNSTPSKPSNFEESSIAVRHVERYTPGNGIITSGHITTPEYPTLCLSSIEEPPTRNEVQPDVSGVPLVFSLPFYYPGAMDQNIIPTPGHLFQCSLNDLQEHSSPALLPHFVPHIPLMPSFPYQTFGINLQSSHIAASTVSSSMTSSPMLEVKSGRIEKRAAALIKFRQKRKDRCFDKKIRYINRKHLAEKRPRVRGQFVKQVTNVDLNQNVLGGSDGDLRDDEDDEPTLKELELISSPEQNAPDC